MRTIAAIILTPVMLVCLVVFGCAWVLGVSYVGARQWVTPKVKATAAAILIAATTYAQTPIWETPPLNRDSIAKGDCFTYMRGFGQYTHPDIGPFEVAVVRNERTGRFYTVRLARGVKPKEGDELAITKEGAL